MDTAENSNDAGSLSDSFLQGQTQYVVEGEVQSQTYYLVEGEVKGQIQCSERWGQRSNPVF